MKETVQSKQGKAVFVDVLDYETFNSVSLQETVVTLSLQIPPKGCHRNTESEERLKDKQTKTLYFYISLLYYTFLLNSQMITHLRQKLQHYIRTDC